MQRRRSSALWLIAATVIVVAVLLLWRFSPLAKFAEPRELVEILSALAQSPWAPAVMIGLFVVGGVLFFPLLALLTATATLFHPVAAFSICISGSVLSALLCYFIAAKLLRSKVRDLFAARMDTVSQALERQGVLAVATVRMVPIAPFTLVNLAAGSIGVRLRDYVAGTALGLAPGTLAITAFAAQLRQIVEHPDFKNVTLLAVIVIAWIAASLGLQRLVSRRHDHKV